jgi:hypothetical protein
MEGNNMATVESTGTSSKIEEQYEKHEKFVGRELFFPSFVDAQ